jgi:hypothetical protein
MLDVTRNDAILRAINRRRNMRVDKAMMVELRKLARDYCGGYKHVLEVQTWDRGNGPEVDIESFTEEDCDKSDVSHFDLIEGVELPDNVGQLDVQVWGVDFKGPSTEGDMDKLGYFHVTLQGGKIMEDWQ